MYIVVLRLRSQLPAFTGGQSEATVTENEVGEVDLPQLQASGLNFQVQRGHMTVCSNETFVIQL